MKKLLIIMLLLVANINAQKYDPIPSNIDVKAVFHVYLDGKGVETDNVLIGFGVKDNTHMYSKINNDFTTYLRSNRVYTMFVTHPDYNKQQVTIITNSPKDSIDISIFLCKSSPDCYVGYYKYNNILKKYIVYE